MATEQPALVFDRAFSPNVGVSEPVADGIARLTAPNASDYTFTGTNAFILGTDPVFVVDAGPNDPAHIEALVRAVEGRQVEAVLLTHTHKDHSAGAKALSKRLNAPIWFAGRHRRSRPLRFLEIDPLAKAGDWGLVPDRVLKDGDILPLGDLEIEVVTTPGHCANHAAFGIKGTTHLLSGDHVMGWNSTLVAVPDGSMRDYLHSLEKLIALPYSTYFPAHGGSVSNARDHVLALANHREKRNRQIVDMAAEKPHSLNDFLEAIYPGMPGRNRFAARLTLGAHVEYLIETGRLKQTLSLPGWRFAAG